MCAHVSPLRCIARGQGRVALFPEKRKTFSGPADLMMRHWGGEAGPELDHLRADAACDGATSCREYSAIWL
jgi:hypothetical protein